MNEMANVVLRNGDFTRTIMIVCTVGRTNCIHMTDVFDCRHCSCCKRHWEVMSTVEPEASSVNKVRYQNIVPKLKE